MLIIDMLGFFQNYSHIHVFKFVLYPRKVVRDGVRVDKIKGSRNLDTPKNLLGNLELSLSEQKMTDEGEDYSGPYKNCMRKECFD